jgi:hypothetical protein
MMRSVIGNEDLIPDAAIPTLPFQPVHPASARA